ncbi:DNA-binding transcriptional LysR family regulator [Rhodoferax ferrireducens]|uniref:DNA-binding transcriptional LysR family regulator n=1 Tax=Rhodoferax ferrireducens TaxID=192843 RepID=A0ABU2C713_9BURK|nr:LysR family transcriptional regulator [Rhodoferax ferrireducens]MDR7377121.1 DNA-binding transcriptional LysR family regulator [Rhodoferax ferrireducens]
MDRLQSMRVFQQVVDDGSFAAAARKFDMSSAVVTRLVGDLEGHLGVRLLQRTTRRLALTDAGETYLARVRHILNDIDEAHAAAQAHAQEMSGVIRILTPPVFATHVLAPLVAEFGRRYPKVVLDIHADSPLVPPIEDYDLTLLGAADTFDANIIARPIASSDGILCASPDYLREHGIPLQPEDLASHRCLRVKLQANRHRSLRLINPEEHNREVEVQIEPALLVNNTTTLIRACLDGAGISIQAIDIVAKYLQNGELHRVLPQWITGRNTLYAALPSRKFIPARTSVFLEFMTEYTRAVLKKMEARQD